MPVTCREPGRLRRMSRLLIGRSVLRRPSDRIEAAVLALLSAVFLACTATAGLLGWRYCQAQTAQAARLHPAVAVVSQVVPATGYPAAEAHAQWRAPGGQRRSGILTTITAPGIWGTQPGARVQIWLTATGNPAPAPPGGFCLVLSTVVLASVASAGGGLVLATCYLVSRAVLDRRRLAGWESDWALTGPRWTTRH